MCERSFQPLRIKRLERLAEQVQVEQEHREEQSVAQSYQLCLQISFLWNNFCIFSWGLQRGIKN